MRDYRGVSYDRIEDLKSREAISTIDEFLRQLSFGVANLNQGKRADSSGTVITPALDDYFYLPGRPGGQIGHGGNAASDSLTLASTRHTTKGKVYLGNAGASAYDELNNRLGIGRADPQAKLHVYGSTGTSASSSFQATSTLSFTPDPSGGLWDATDYAATLSDDGGTSTIRTQVLDSSTNTITFSVGVTVDPAGTSWLIDYSAAATSSPPSLSLTYTLYDSAGVGHSCTPIDIGTTWALGYQPLTATCNITGGSGTPNTLKLSFTAINGNPYPLCKVSYILVTGNIITTGGPLTRVEQTSALTGTISDWLNSSGTTIASISNLGAGQFQNVLLEDPGAGTGTISLIAPTGVTPYSLTFPANDGNNLDVLQTNGSGTLSWVTFASLLDDDLEEIGAITRTRGDLIVGGASAWVRLPIGTAAQLLQVNTGATDPAWVSMSSDATLAAGGALTLANTAVSPGPYGSATQVGTFTVDAKGRLTAAANVTITGVAPGAHVLLSTSHSDTLAASPVLGDLIHGNGTPAWARLAGQTTTTRKFLRQTGDGALSAIPAWDTLLTADVPNLSGTNTGDQTSIVGITGTLAQFNTAMTDADFAIAARTIAAGTGLTGGGDLSADRTIALTVPVAIASGGTNKALTLSAGGMVWTDVDSFEVLAAGSAGQILRSGGATTPVWSTATYPAAAGTSGNLLQSDGTNWNSVTVASLLDDDLEAIATIADGSTGFLAKTATNTWALRTLTGTAAQIDVSNGAGTAGAPVFSLPDALTFTGKTVTNGTFVTPTIAAAGWTNANHTHAGSTTGGTIALSDTTGTLAIARGGTDNTTALAAFNALGGGVVFRDAGGSLGLGGTPEPGSASYRTLSFDGTGGGQIEFNTNGTYTHYIYTTAAAMFFYASGANQLAWTVGGNFGIGKSVPTLKLDIEDTAVVTAAGIRSTHTGGFSEWRATNDEGSSSSRVAFGVGGTAAGTTYGNMGYIIASFNLNGILLATSKAGALFKFRAGSSTVDRRIIGPTKVLVNNTLTSLVDCTIANNTTVAGGGEYKVEVFDGTDLQTEIGTFQYYATKKGTAAIANLQAFQTGIQTITTAGTLSVVITITGSSNTATVKITANSSLTPSAGYPLLSYELRNLTQQVVAIV